MWKEGGKEAKEGVKETAGKKKQQLRLVK